ncbi:MULTISPECIES: site-specific integrase [unclassified Undibacterium]|uniref:site-specific integrase n=1 Tax=unclassified Undibacterium TaxID=2630295 RepID=UPI002AC96E54|nr:MULTISPECIES: site-specific integrase [unclassified Undibacterium]MEB0139483.1 site-specific integrase [Undibacterium sp. CCC2.1]MEB0172408.1 site-specific integrase [Undibacterium sp. CCC1.1]MEB0175735.1 site-specific integrase [Undibacterium sp. CCC3.4]MEB0214523.1 site-specific integrase [Undibacterium sp. 5I2]WPX42918.1 site-specific integrase [Undibacterium sp. CCC3.4]
MPLLCWSDSAQPVLLPLIYLMLRRRHKSVNTIRRDVSVLKWLYEWAEMSLGLNIDAQIFAGRIEKISGHLDQFAYWLRSGRVALNVVGRIGRSEPADWLHPRTYNEYLASLRHFLLWAAERYPSQSETESSLRQQIADIKNKIHWKFEALTLGGKTEVDVKGLDSSQVERVKSLMFFNAPGNPFRNTARLRNWIVVNVLLETGMRRGELLKLKTTDLHEIDGKFYLVIRREPDDPTDSRAVQPAQKTLSRTVSISTALFSDIEQYILTARRPTRNKRRIVLKHQFLLTSERGTPLSLSAVNYLFDVVHAHLFRQSDVPFHPHILRNTFCNNYLEWRVDDNGAVLDSALDELRQICGWNLTSKMPLRYAAKWISAQANEHNRRRINAVWNEINRKDQF